MPRLDDLREKKRDPILRALPKGESMSKEFRAFAIASAFLVSAAVAQPAVAQEKKARAQTRAQEILIDNDRVRVSESVFKPGEENPMARRGFRVTRVLKGNTTVVRTSKDGKTEKIEYKEGMVLISPAGTTSTKNVGKSAVTLYTVVLKPE